MNKNVEGLRVETETVNKIKSRRKNYHKICLHTFFFSVPSTNSQGKKEWQSNGMHLFTARYKIHFIFHT